MPPGVVHSPDLLFLAFFENGKENHQKGKDFLCSPNPKILGKEGKNAPNRKEFLEKEKGKEIQKGKEKKIRVLPTSTSLRRVGKSDPEREAGEQQPYCHTNVLDVGAQIQFCLFAGLF